MTIFLLSREVSQKTTSTVRLLSIAAIALAIIVLVLMAVTNKGFNTKALVFAAAAVASSFVLSFIKFTPVAYGGSITLASFVPVLIYTYCQGFAKGLVAGIVFGLLNFIQSPYILVPETFVLDYILGFLAISLMAFAPKLAKGLTAQILLGTALVYSVRFIMHFAAGFIYFNYGVVIDSFPTANGAIYSFIYNLSYLVPDMIICMAAFYALVKTQSFSKILELVKK